MAAVATTAAENATVYALAKQLRLVDELWEWRREHKGAFPLEAVAERELRRLAERRREAEELAAAHGFEPELRAFRKREGRWPSREECKDLYRMSRERRRAA